MQNKLQEEIEKLIVGTAGLAIEYDMEFILDRVLG